jgi:SAM-dependent methyltransferase
MRIIDHGDFLERTKDGYDCTAGAYAERFHHYLDDKPVDLAMVGAFAGLVSMSDDKRVVDVGCGTGATTAIYRVLIPGGFVLLAFQVGHEPLVLDQAFGQRVELTFFRRQPGHVLALLERAGLQPYAELVREPNDGTFESTKQAYLIVRKPGAPA